MNDRSKIIVLSLLVIMFACAAIVYGAGKSSANYIIHSDVISGGGGESGSLNYVIEHTTGQASAVGESSSSNYYNYGGFWVTVSGASCPTMPVRIAGASPSYFASLQAAYNAAGSGDTIQGQAAIFNEDLNINLNKSVSIEGGYDCDYESSSGFTYISGTMNIESGSVSISNLSLL